MLATGSDAGVGRWLVAVAAELGEDVAPVADVAIGVEEALAETDEGVATLEDDAEVDVELVGEVDAASASEEP